MWILLFAVVLAIALGFGLGAVVLESYEEGRIYGRRPVRSLRASAYLREYVVVCVIGSDDSGGQKAAHFFVRQRRSPAPELCNNHGGMPPPLMLSRRFAPLFWCQFFAAFNDNFLKTALVFLILFHSGARRMPRR